MPNIINADNGVISGVAGIKTSADTSGVLNIQTNGTTAISISTAQVVSFPTASGINFGGQSTFAAGTAAAPSISVTGNTNTGIFFPAADTIAFSEGGVEAARIDSSGQVGIGTASPAAKLDIGSGNLNFSSTAQRIRGDFSNATAANRLMIQSNVTNGTTTFGIMPNGTGTVANFAAFGNAVDTANSSVMFIGVSNNGTEVRFNSTISGTGTYLPMTFNTGGSERARIDTSGNLGIGTASPTNKLNVSGNGYLFALNGGLTNRVAQTFGNTGGGLDLGIEGSAGGTVFTGGSSYAGVIGTNNATVLQLGTNGTIRATLDTSGNLGIGASPAASNFSGSYTSLLVKGNSANKIGTVIAQSFGTTNATKIEMFAGDGANEAGLLVKSASTAMTFYTGSVPDKRMTLDSSGNLGIGTASPTVKLDVNGSGTIRGELAAILPSVVGSITARNTSTTGAELHIRPNSGKNGWLSFTEDSVADRWVLGTAAGNGSLIFGTGNPSGYTERARITSGGDFGIGTQAGTGTRTLTVQTNTSGDPTISLTAAGADAGSFWFERSTLRLYARASNTGGVYLASGGTSWTAVSDERKKDIIEPISNASEKVASLRAVVGKYKTDKDGVRRSFLIAQDVQAVFPEAIDASDENELGLSYTDTIPLLVAAIQEQQAMIEELKAKVTALESK